MVIAKTASRSVAAKAGKMGEAVLDTQANFVTPEVGGWQDVLSEHESLDDNDVKRNADFYVNHEVDQN